MPGKKKDQKWGRRVIAEIQISQTITLEMGTRTVKRRRPGGEGQSMPGIIFFREMAQGGDGRNPQEKVKGKIPRTGNHPYSRPGQRRAERESEKV